MPARPLMPMSGRLALLTPRADTAEVRRAEFAVVVGVTLMLLGFAAGTYQPSATLEGASVPCRAAIDLRALPFNEAEPFVGETARPPTTHELRAETACQGITPPFRLFTWSGLAVGGIMALTGWTARREREGPPEAVYGASRRA